MPVATDRVLTPHAHWKQRELKARRAYGIIRLGGECCRCGEQDWEILQFDHIDPELKCFEICRSNHYSMQAFLEEVKKCRLLCISCHSMKSSMERSGRSLKFIADWIREYREADCEELPF